MMPLMILGASLKPTPARRLRSICNREPEDDPLLPREERGEAPCGAGDAPEGEPGGRFGGMAAISITNITGF